MTIEEFIRLEAGLPPYPGACCRVVDKWINERAGFSALRRFGRDFESDGDVALWLSEPGGIAIAVNRVMRACGFKKTKTPEAGDVGLVIHGAVVGNLIPMRMAILSHGGWLSRDDVGLALTPAKQFWKAWSIPPLEG